MKQNYNIFLIIFTCILIALFVGAIFWIFILKENKKSESKEYVHDVNPPIFLDPIDLEIALKKGHLHFEKTLPPFFHYVLDNSELSEFQLDILSKEEGWKNSKNYLNVLWGNSDCEKIFRSMMPDVYGAVEPKKMLLIKKFIPMMLMGGIYHSPNKPIPKKYKKQLTQQSCELSVTQQSCELSVTQQSCELSVTQQSCELLVTLPNNTKIYLFRDPSSGKIDEDFFASTHAPEFWKNVILNILNNPTKKSTLANLFLFDIE